MTSEQAEIIGLQALGWLAAQDEIWPTFLGATGAAASDARDRAGDPAFLSSVLEFLTSDDSMVTEFCDAHGLKYEDPLSARFTLPGSERVEWT